MIPLHLIRDAVGQAEKLSRQLNHLAVKDPRLDPACDDMDEAYEKLKSALKAADHDAQNTDPRERVITEDNDR